MKYTRRSVCKMLPIGLGVLFTTGTPRSQEPKEIRGTNENIIPQRPYARGGPVTAGNFYIVGEKCCEVFIPSRSGLVLE